MNSEFSFSLNRAELFALGNLMASFPLEGSETAGTRYLVRHLDQLCSSMRSQVAVEDCEISLSLEQTEADALARLLGRLTVDQIETMLDDESMADTASLAIWNILTVLRPISLSF